jgi:hypothetical protein
MGTLILAQITPVITETATPIPTVGEILIMPTATVEVIEQVLPTSTPATQIPEGTQFKELIFIAIICLLILIIVLQVYLGGAKEENIPE